LHLLLEEEEEREDDCLDARTAGRSFVLMNHVRLLREARLALVPWDETVPYIGVAWPVSGSMLKRSTTKNEKTRTIAAAKLRIDTASNLKPQRGERCFFFIGWSWMWVSNKYSTEWGILEGLLIGLG
jgi:hypothetical protein